MFERALPLSLNGPTCMQRIRPDLDIILDILKAVTEAQPHSTFAVSLLHQYQERGGLSKKQLQGLYGKALKTGTIPAQKMATLEAIILKKHTKERSELPEAKPLYEKDVKTGELIDALLRKYPNHKRVLFLKSRYDINEPLIPAEITELEKFRKLLL
jgi:hypothetical protein